jgi:hypothetical protein
MSHVLDSRDRAKAAPTFDAAGLYLMRVEYDSALELPRAMSSRIHTDVVV